MSDIIARRSATRLRRRFLAGCSVLVLIAAGVASAELVRRRTARPATREVSDKPPAREAFGRPPLPPTPARPTVQRPAPAPSDDSRKFWRFDLEPGLTGSGHFKRMPDGWWEEMGRDGATLMGMWEELGRTAEYVELYDARRNTKTRLGAGRAWLASGRDTNELGTSLGGDWEQEPAPTQVARANTPAPAAPAEPAPVPRVDPLRGVAGALVPKPGAQPVTVPEAKPETKPPAELAGVDKDGFLIPDGREPAKPKGKGKAGAAKPDKRPPLGPKLDPLVDQLTGRDAKARLKAADQLGALGADAAPAARYLCTALLDPVPAVSTAALKALETVAPELYEPLTAICVDAVVERRIFAITSIGKLGVKGQPAVPFLLGCLSVEAAGRPSPINLRPYYLLAAVRATGCQRPETLAAYRAFAGPGCVNPTIRLDAITFLVKWADEEGDRRVVVAPLVMGAMSDPAYQMTCINIAATYGKLCKPSLPLLRALKLSPNALTRAAATKAVAAIEAAE